MTIDHFLAVSDKSKIDPSEIHHLTGRLSSGPRAAMAVGCSLLPDTSVRIQGELTAAHHS
eukprot:9579785-Prorocentrum_lima.AAC.1